MHKACAEVVPDRNMPLKTIFLALAALGGSALSSAARADILYDSGAASGMITVVNSATPIR